MSSKIKGELEDERKCARSVIDDDLRQQALMWEKLPSAMDKTAEEAYLDGVRESQVYVGIIGAMPSPGSFEEFQEALRTNKRLLMFIKKLSTRDSKLDTFIENARKFKCGDFATSAEFASKLKDSLLALMADHTSAQLQVEGDAYIQYLREYNSQYIRPLLEETNESVNILQDRRFTQLPVDTWISVRRSIYAGYQAPLDQDLEAFYRDVAKFNELKARAFEEHKRIIEKVIEQLIPVSANRIQQDEVVQRLIDNAAFFVIIRDQDADYWRAYDCICGDLDIPLSNINAKSSTRIRGKDLVDKMLGDTRRSILMSFLNHSFINEYNHAFDKLLTEAKSIRAKLTQIYSGKTL